MLNRPHIVLSPASNNAHLQQIFAGFETLAAQRVISLSYRWNARARFGLTRTGILDSDAFLVVAEIAGGPTIAFDTHDSAVICDPVFAVCDLYLKRSYATAEHGSRRGILPLGPNFEIERDERSWHSMMRALRLPHERSPLRGLARALRLPGTNVVTEADFVSSSQLQSEPRILFVARARDPRESRTPSPEKTRDRIEISTQRAHCIRELRQAFGERFTGGLYRDAYALEHFPDVVVDESFSTERLAHLARLHEHDICVSSVGLHRSVGWKFAEYLAAGRAIVAEHMAFEGPGGLADGTHFLGFSSPKECVAAVQALLKDAPRRGRFMAAAQSYYRNWVSPPAMIRQVLSKAGVVVDPV